MASGRPAQEGPAGRPLRVFHVITSLARGGAQMHLLQLVAGQRRAGHTVDVAFLKDPVLVPEFHAALSRNVATSLPWEGPGAHHAPGALIDLHARVTLSPWLLPRLVRLVCAGRYDVVHTHLLKANVYGALAVHLASLLSLLSVAQTRRRPALVASKHNDEQVLRRPLVGRLHGLLSHLDDRVIALSDHVLRYMAHTGRVPRDRLRRVYYGIDLDGAVDAPRHGDTGTRGHGDAGTRRHRSPRLRVPASPRPRVPASPASPAPGPQSSLTVRDEFGLPPQGPLLLCVGRLDPQKGHLDLLAAMREVVEVEPDARLLLVGESQLAPPGYRAQVLAAAAEPGLAGRVVLAGERRDVPRLLAACDVFVMASHWEGFGLVFLEAMAAGKPVVATRVSAVPEVVSDGDTGLLVPPGDPAALAAATLRLCRDRGLAARLGQAGRARAARLFSARRMVDETLAVYTEIPNGSKLKVQSSTAGSPPQGKPQP